jgi:uncharacterized protein YdeI (YjbR/CyaY-like superfamily)
MKINFEHYDHEEICSIYSVYYGMHLGSLIDKQPFGIFITKTIVRAIRKHLKEVAPLELHAIEDQVKAYTKQLIEANEDGRKEMLNDMITALGEGLEDDPDTSLL